MQDLFIPIVALGAAVVFIFLAYGFSNFYIKSTPDEVTILTGRKGVRYIRAGGALRVPVIERMDRMSIAPFQLDVPVERAVSKEGVAVTVEATALIRFGSSDTSIRTAAERFMSANRELLHNTIREILIGHVRSIVAKMTVEEINGSREVLTHRVLEEAGSDFNKIGMELEVLTIKHITDDVGYLDALGRKRTAEVLRDAEIGEAEARRQIAEQTAAARQAGAIAQAAADAAIAQANKDRDVRVAQYNAEVQKEQASAEQAGPLARATAQRQVVIAEVAIEEERERASIAVEQQRVARAERAQEANIIVPARAKRDALVAESDGSRLAAINRAQGEQQRLSLEGHGEAEARKARAEAREAELVAEANGTKAGLLAEAEGREKLAAAQNAFAEAGRVLELGPKLIEALPQIVAASAAPLGNIDKLYMFDTGSGNGNSPMNSLIRNGVTSVAIGFQLLKDAGFDLNSMFGVRNPADSDGESRAALDRVAASVAEDEPAAPA
jgi:flotillin